MRVAFRLIPLVALVPGLSVGIPDRASAQAGLATEMARLKVAYLADFDDLAKKFVTLAEAIPAEKYTWQPMPGVRRVHEVLGLISAENYFSLTPAFGGKPPADLPVGNDAEKTMEAIADKTPAVKHIRESFALARRAIATWSGKPEGPIDLWGDRRSVADAFMVVMADQHEHLGQLIAYARMNRIVPPWSK